MVTSINYLAKIDQAAIVKPSGNGRNFDVSGNLPVNLEAKIKRRLQNQRRRAAFRRRSETRLAR